VEQLAFRDTWVGEAGMWPRLAPRRPADPPALRAVLVLRNRGDVLSPLTESDDRAIAFLTDAATPEALDLLEAQVRHALRVEVTPVSG
jgi:hypothetical protein